VFTLPDELIPVVVRNKELIYKLFFDTCSKTLMSVCADEKYFGTDIGFFAILHTWGQKLNFHPHIHCVVPGGGFSQKKQQWIKAPFDYLAPVDVLKNRFRSIFLTKLKQFYKNKELFLKGAVFENPGKFQKLIDKLFACGWVVHIKKTFKNSSSVIKYLGRYTHKTAITNHRILYTDDNIVRFKYRDYADNNREKIMEIDCISFMRRFLMHVLPPRFVRIRYYGILSHRNKKKMIKACREFFEIKPEKQHSKIIWQHLLLKITGNDITICSKCGKGNMILAESVRLISNRAPPLLKFV